MDIIDLYKESIAPGLRHKDGFSNHLPMALLSLKSLGASYDTVKSFCSSYEENLIADAFIARDTIKGKDQWLSLLGDSSKFHDHYGYFEKLIETSGIESIWEYVKILLSSPVSAAFHAPIRFAYMIEEDIYDDAAYVLAVWSVGYVHDLPEMNIEKFDIDTFLNKDIEHINDIVQKELPSISLRARELLKEDKLQSFLSSLCEMKTNQDAGEIVLKLIQKRFSFTGIHLLTGLYAVETIEKKCKFKSKQLLASILVTYLTDVKARARSFKGVYLPEDQIRLKAIKSAETHVIKLTDVCLKKYKETANRDYLALAHAYEASLLEN